MTTFRCESALPFVGGFFRGSASAARGHRNSEAARRWHGSGSLNVRWLLEPDYISMGGVYHLKICSKPTYGRFECRSLVADDERVLRFRYPASVRDPRMNTYTATIRWTRTGDATSPKASTAARNDGP
jgi:hypothetical protein